MVLNIHIISMKQRNSRQSCSSLESLQCAWASHRSYIEIHRPESQVNWSGKHVQFSGSSLPVMLSLNTLPYYMNDKYLNQYYMNKVCNIILSSTGISPQIKRNIACAFNRN